MQPREYVVSIFALIILLFFCAPIFALAIGMWRGFEPDTLTLRMLVGLTNADVVNAVHSLLLPLVGAVIIFRSDYFSGLVGTLVLVTLCAAILIGFFVFMATSPTIFGRDARFSPYINEYPNVHNAVFDMISMLILLFLAKLGLSNQESSGTRKADPSEPNPNNAGAAAPPAGPVPAPAVGGGV